MIKMMLSEIAQSIGGRLIYGDAEVERVFTDSRDSSAGGLFVALKGPHFDAHDFVAQVAEQGAKGVVLEKESACQVPQIIVENTKIALGQIAKLNREKLNAQMIAITGSSGKTTVKEMVATILQRVGNVLATNGNFNNEIGAPITLLRMNDSHQFGVIELGANHAGEIAYTASLTQPDVAMINNVAAAHLEGFGDLQGVARAKGEIYGEIKAGGTAVVNLDDDFADYWLKHIEHQVLTYSAEKQADVFASNIELDEEQCARFILTYENKELPVQLSLSGKHNVYNALAAASCCIAIGIPLEEIVKGLAVSPVVSGRLLTEKLDNGCRVIDDTYNANLDSMKAAIDLLSNYKGRRVLVIGDMAELGEFGRQCHEEIGTFASDRKIDFLYTCGVLTRFTQSAFDGEGEHFSNQQELIQKIKQEANSGTTILVKGSRSAHMEKVVTALMETSTQSSTEPASTEGKQ